MELSRLLCMVFVLALVIMDASATGGVPRGDSALLRRKMFWERKWAGFEKFMPEEERGSLGKRNDVESMPEDWELRRVPAGPDPLHHNGQDPKKPRTP